MHTNTWSPEQIARQFESPAAAIKYFTKAPATAIDSREKQCVHRLLNGYDVGAHVLDIACGTGRMLPLLMELKFKITAADYSGFMIEKAMAGMKAMNENCDMEFGVENAMHMSFPDESFDIVLCHRLMHHFSDPRDRIMLLKELARVSRKTVLISFYWNFSWDALTFFLKHFLRGSRPHDRIPIAWSKIRREIDIAELEIERVLPKKLLLSRQCYLLLKKKDRLK